MRNSGTFRRLVLASRKPRRSTQVRNKTFSPHSVRDFARKTNETPFYGEPRPLQNADSSSSSSSSLFNRLSLTLQSATTAFMDPTRADAVAQLGELTGHVALTSMYDTMMQDPVGQQILRERPRVSKETIPIEKLIESAGKSTSSSSNMTTFGQAYGQFLVSHGFDPDERSEVQFLDDNPELAYVMTRYRQCHDYWHVLTDLPPTVVGELGLKWLELLQFNLPVAALSATVGSLRLNAKERELLFQHYLPWAVRMSRQSEFLLNVYYEQEFDTPLQELRDRLRIEPAPKPP